jgi:hypothetical protein
VLSGIRRASGRSKLTTRRFKDLSPAEGQQLPGQRGGACARRTDLLDVRAMGILDWKLVEQDLAVSEDAGQEVVEVVSDSACKLADRLHLLRLDRRCARRRRRQPPAAHRPHDLGPVAAHKRTVTDNHVE